MQGDEATYPCESAFIRGSKTFPCHAGHRVAAAATSGGQESRTGEQKGPHILTSERQPCAGSLRRMKAHRPEVQRGIHGSVAEALGVSPWILVL